MPHHWTNSSSRARATRTPSTSATASSCPKNIANSYLVTTSDGDVMINTGTDFEAPEIKSRFARVEQRTRCG